MTEAAEGGEDLKSSHFVEEAMNAYQDLVFRTACSMLNSLESARDITQETFVKLYQSDKEFADDAHLRNWLVTATRNACRDVLRRQKNVAIELVDPTTPDALEKLMADKAQLSESSIPIDKDDYLWRHVAQLPVAQRTAVFLHYAEDFSIAEIADAMEKSPANIRAQLSRAKKSLRKMINAERNLRKEDEQHEMAHQKTIRDLPIASAVAKAGRRNKRADPLGHTHLGGTRARPGMRSHHQHASISRPNDDEDGHPCAEVA